MSLGKYHINGLRFFGLAIILVVFFNTIVELGDEANFWINSVADLIANTNIGYPDRYMLSPLYWLGMMAIFIGSILLSLEKKE